MPDVRFRLKRWDPERDAPDEERYDEFTVPYESSLTVLEGLFYIQEHLDGSLAFRYCYQAAVLRLVRHVHRRHVPARVPDQRAPPRRAG